MNRDRRRLPLPRGKELIWGGRTMIMGVVNVTPDSFSDGGLFFDVEQAAAHGLNLLDQGADILDIGGESTRPGSEPISADEECARVLPLIERIAGARPDALISIDTMKSLVAARALDAGALMINDISAMTFDRGMIPLAARSGAGVVLMHMRGKPKTMQEAPCYQDVVAEVKEYLVSRAQTLAAQGVARKRIIIDPGIGFGKTFAHNLSIIRRLGELREAGYPVMLGASRKAFIGHLTGRLDPGQRLWGTIGAHVAGAILGADLVRVHDVAPVREALMVADAVIKAA